MLRSLRFRRSFVAATAVLSLGAYLPSFAGDILVSVTGAKQGKFKGEGMRKGTESKVIASFISYELKTSRDVASGMASGKRQHTPICIRKPLGAASPQLITALATNEVLTSAMFEILVPGPRGDEIVGQVMTIANASVASYKLFTPAEGKPEQEEICFVFQRIDIDNKLGGTSAVDDLRNN